MTAQSNYISNVPEVSRKLREKILTWCNSITEIKVTTEEELFGAVDLTKQISGYKKELESRRVVDKKPHIEAGKAIDRFYKEVEDSLRAVGSKINYGISVYQQKKERERQEKQRKADIAAAKERERKLQKAEEDRKKADELREQGKEDQASVFDTQAAEKEAAAEQTVAKTIEGPTKLDGIHKRITWTAEITDPVSFVGWAIKSGRTELLLPNEVAFRKYAGMIKQPLTVPGGRIYSKESTVVKSD